MIFVAAILLFALIFESYSQNNCWELYQRIRFIYSATYYNGNLWVCHERGLSSINTETYEITHYNKFTTNVIPDNVYSVTYDIYGNLWIGTLSIGLIKYDFKNWTIYDKTKYYYLGNRILKVQGDRGGNVYISSSRGLSLYIEDTIRSTPVINAIIKTFAIDSNDVVWVDTHGSVIGITKDSILRAYSKYYDRYKTINVKSIAIDKHSKIYIGGDNGIYFSNQDKFEKLNIELIKDRSIENLALDKNGNLWISTEDKLYIFDGQSAFNLPIPDTIISNRQKISYIEIDDKSRAWICINDGVILYENGQWKFINLNKFNINNNSIMNMKMIGDTLWVINGDGVLNFTNENWYNLDLTEFSSQIFDVTKDNSGNFWFTSLNNGVAKFDGKNWTIYPKSIKYFPTNGALKVFVDNHNRKWFATTNSGIAVFDDEKWSVFSVAKENFISDNVVSITQDNNGIFWIGTTDKGLIKVYFPSDGKLQYELTEIRKYVNVIEVIDDKLWVGGIGWGIAIYDYDDWKYFNTQNGLPSNNIYSIAQDSIGRIWIATDQGIAIYEDGKWYGINSSNSPLSNNIITAITIDSRDNKWIGTGNSGVYRIKCNYEFVSTINDVPQIDNDFIIFPNPFTDVINFNSNIGNILKIEIINVYGQLVMELNEFVVSGNNYKLHLKTLTNGTYFIKITTDKGIKSVKIIKSK